MAENNVRKNERVAVDFDQGEFSTVTVRCLKALSLLCDGSELRPNPQNRVSVLKGMTSWRTL